MTLSRLLLMAALATSVAAAAGLTGTASAARGTALTPPKKGCSATDISGCTSDPAPLVMRNAKPKPGYYVGHNPTPVSLYVTPDGKQIVGFTTSYGYSFWTQNGTVLEFQPTTGSSNHCTVQGTIHQKKATSIKVSSESGSKVFRLLKEQLFLDAQFLSSTKIDGGARVLGLASPCGPVDVMAIPFTVTWKNASQPK